MSERTRLASQQTVPAVISIALLATLATAQVVLGQDPQRRYAVLPREQTTELLEQAVKDKRIPDPTPFDEWRISELARHAQGLRIDGSQYVILAYGIASIRMSTPKRNLGQLLRMAETAAETKDGIPFWLNGALYSTVDLQVVGLQTFSRGEGDLWVKGNQVIARGGFVEAEISFGKRARQIICGFSGRKISFLGANHEMALIAALARLFIRTFRNEKRKDFVLVQAKKDFFVFGCGYDEPCLSQVGERNGLELAADCLGQNAIKMLLMVIYGVRARRDFEAGVSAPIDRLFSAIKERRIKGGRLSEILARS